MMRGISGGVEALEGQGVRRDNRAFLMEERAGDRANGSAWMTGAARGAIVRIVEEITVEEDVREVAD